jgi:hypothetical protein
MMDIGIQIVGSMGKLATTDRVFCPTLMCPEVRIPVVGELRLESFAIDMIAGIGYEL